MRRQGRFLPDRRRPWLAPTAKSSTFTWGRRRARSSPGLASRTESKPRRTWRFAGLSMSWGVWATISRWPSRIPRSRRPSAFPEVLSRSRTWGMSKPLACKASVPSTSQSSRAPVPASRTSNFWVVSSRTGNSIESRKSSRHSRSRGKPRRRTVRSSSPPAEERVRHALEAEVPLDDILAAIVDFYGQWTVGEKEHTIGYLNAVLQTAKFLGKEEALLPLAIGLSKLPF